MNPLNCDIINRNKLTISLITLAVSFLGGCFGGGSKESDLMIINVLDKNYYQDCHVKGSVNIPFEDIESKLSGMNKQKTYVLYCSNYACMAAPSAATMMKDAGFKNVYVYTGGIVDWYQKKYPYQGPATMEYLKDENEPLGDDDHEGVSVLTADQLKLKMETAGLLS